MAKPGRIPCINPSCRRTAPREGDPETQIICGKCWRALPVALRNRDRQLRGREKRLLRMTQRAYDRGDIGADRVARIAGLIEGAMAQNWKAMGDYFKPGDRPAGLDGFLQEVGL